MVRVCVTEKDGATWQRERKLRDAPETTENINQVNFTENIQVSGVGYKYKFAPPHGIPCLPFADSLPIARRSSSFLLIRPGARR